MKSVSQIKWSAFVALAAIGAMGAVGACSKDGGPGPDPVEIAAPTSLAATVVSETQIDLAWTDNATNEDGYRIESCSGAACATFAQIGTVAANVNVFSNTGLTAGTSYSFRVRAHNAEGASAFSNTATASTEIIPPPPPPPPVGAVLIGAGEITSCNSLQSNLTAQLIDTVIAHNPDAIVYTVGNNLADVGPTASYTTCFDPRWGRFLDRMRPALGNRDYDKGPAAPFDYFGAKVGNRDEGWYSFDVGDNWHVVVLNTSDWQHGASIMTDPNSPMMTWLAADLAANTKQCTMAIMNLRRYYSYGSMENMNVKLAWNMLHSAGAEVVVSGTDKYYERWAPQNHDMQRDDATGVRQFIAGTGGRTLDNFSTWKPVAEVPNLEVRDATTHGVLKFTLNANSYTWEFIPTTPGGFTDTGTTNCH